MKTLVEYLADREITQAAFAERVGVTQAQISRLCAKSQPSLALAIRISAETSGAVPVTSWPAFRVLAGHEAIPSATAAPSTEAASQ